MIPWIAGAVGYFTNVLALQMTFWPIEFFGVELFRIEGEPWGLFGWQGIVPSKAEKMASICFDLMTQKLFSIREIFQRLDPVKFGEVMSDRLLLTLDSVISEVAMEYMPSTWESLPKDVKDDIIVTADAEAAVFLEEFMRDMIGTLSQPMLNARCLCLMPCD